MPCHPNAQTPTTDYDFKALFVCSGTKPWFTPDSQSLPELGAGAPCKSGTRLMANSNVFQHVSCAR